MTQTQMSTNNTFTDVMNSDDVLKRYPGLISRRELDAARRKRRIRWMPGARGQATFTPPWVEEYLRSKVRAEAAE